MTYVLMRRDPLRFVTYAAGRSNVGGHLTTHPNLWKVKTWKTRKGIEEWSANHPGFARNGYEVVTYDEGREAIEIRASQYR